MFTRRDFTLVLFTALTAGSIVAFAQSTTKPAVMASTAIEWTSTEVRPSATGSGRRFFDGPSPTLDRLECHASTLNAGAANHEIVKRTNDEVIIIKEGTIEAYAGDKWVKLGPGSVIFNAANADQAMRNVGTTPATYHVISFRPTPAVAAPAARPAN